jgi:hypothetical protein
MVFGTSIDPAHVRARGGCHARRDDERGHVHLGGGEAAAVGQRAVLAEALAVVGGHDHVRVEVAPVPLQPLEQPLQPRVQALHVLVVEGARARDLGRHVLALPGALQDLLRPQRLARAAVPVGRVRIEVVEPEELPRALSAVELREGGPGHRGGQAVVALLGIAARAHALGQGLLERVEALREAEAREQRERSDHGRRGVAGALQRLRDRGELVAEHHALVGDAVLPGVQAGEEGGVAGLRGGRGGVEALEHQPALRPRAQERHRGRGARAALEAVVAQRVQGDEHDAGAARLGPAGPERHRGAEDGHHRQPQRARGHADDRTRRGPGAVTAPPGGA